MSKWIFLIYIYLNPGGSMSDIKAEMRSKCTKLKKVEMAFYFYEKVGTLFKEPVLLLDLPGTVKTEARVFSKKQNKTHTCRGRALFENDQFVLEVQQGSEKSLAKAIDKKPFKGTAIGGALVRKGAAPADEPQAEEITASKGNTQANIDTFMRRHGKAEAALEEIKDILKEWRGNGAEGWEPYVKEFKGLRLNSMPPTSLQRQMPKRHINSWGL